MTCFVYDAHTGVKFLWGGGGGGNDDWMLVGGGGARQGRAGQGGGWWFEIDQFIYVKIFLYWLLPLLECPFLPLFYHLPSSSISFAYEFHSPSLPQCIAQVTRNQEFGEVTPLPLRMVGPCAYLEPNA